MKSTLKLSNSSNIEGFENDYNRIKDQHRSMPNYAIVLIAVGSTVLLLALIYFIYSKYKKKENSKNGKIKYKGPIREVWSNPDIGNANNIINWDKMERLGIKQNASNAQYSNRLHPNSVNQSTSNVI
jgi:hypothetical protein